jgi:hypothetical protein
LPSSLLITHANQFMERAISETLSNDARNIR